MDDIYEQTIVMIIIIMYFSVTKLFIVYFCDMNERFMNSVVDVFLNEELRNTDIA